MSVTQDGNTLYISMNGAPLDEINSITEICNAYPTCTAVHIFCIIENTFVMPYLPDHIIELALCASYVAVTNFPKHMQSFTTSSSSIKQLDLSTCMNLTDARITSCDELSILKLPNTLTKLTLHHCPMLMPDFVFPTQLCTLSLAGLNLPVPNLPLLTSLTIMLCADTPVYISDMPSLTRLEILHCNTVIFPDNYQPSGLEVLSLVGIDTLHIHSLPTNLHTISIRKMDVNNNQLLSLLQTTRVVDVHLFELSTMKTVPHLPDSVLHLQICGCYRISHLVTPPKCEILEIQDCMFLSTLSFPKTVRTMMLYKTGVYTLPELHEGLEELEYYGNAVWSNVFPYLPNSLQYLKIHAGTFLACSLAPILYNMGVLMKSETTTLRILSNRPLWDRYHPVTPVSHPFNMDMIYNSHKNNILFGVEHLYTLRILQRVCYTVYSHKYKQPLLCWYLRANRRRIEMKYSPSALEHYLENAGENWEKELDVW